MNEVLVRRVQFASVESCYDCVGMGIGFSVNLSGFNFPLIFATVIEWHQCRGHLCKIRDSL